jgi:hypothetical protein
MKYSNEKLAEWQAAVGSQDMGAVLTALSAISDTGDQSLLYLLQEAGTGLRASFKIMKMIRLNEDDPPLNFEEFRDQCIKKLMGLEQPPSATMGVKLPSTQATTRKIFISYNHHDQARATRLALELEQQRDIDVFIDHWDMSAGESLLDRIEKGIDESSFLIALLSPNSVESKWVRTELQYAFLREQHQQGMRIIPVVIEECKLPIHVAGRLHIDMRSASDWERSLQYLVNTIRGHKPFSKVVSEYINSTSDNSPYQDKMKREGRRLILELAQHRELDVEENQKWMLWELYHKLLPGYTATMKLGRNHDSNAPAGSYIFMLVDRWNARMCTIMLKEEEFRRGLWSGEFDLIRGCRLKAKNFQFCGDLGRLSSDRRYNPHTQINPFLDSCAPTMKPILESLDSALDRFQTGSQQSFLYDLDKIVFASADRKIKVVVGSAIENMCYAFSHLLLRGHSESGPQWAVFEVFDPFFASLKYTSVCPAHLDHVFEGDVDLMDTHGEVPLGLA